jgi:hypothetical protein
MQSGLSFQPVHLPGGRRGVGARTHCMHGKHNAMEETVLDWRPFETFTVKMASAPPYGTVWATYVLEPIDQGRGTRLHLYLQGRVMPGPLNRAAVRLMYGRMVFPTICRNLASRLAEAMAGRLPEEGALAPA